MMRTPHDPPLTERASFTHWTHDKLRFNDTDRLGHINNAVFATAFETGRVSFLYHPEQPLAPAGSDFVIVRLVVDFRAEMHYPGDVEIGTRLLAIGRSSFTVGQALFKDGICTATGESVLVLIDHATRKAIPLPEQLRAALRALAPA